MVETKIGGMHLQAREGQRLLATLDTKRKAWNRFSFRSFRESIALLTDT